MVDGKRIPGIRHDQHGANYCTSNPGRDRGIHEELRAGPLVDGPYRDADIVAISCCWIRRGTRWCECEACKALGHPHRPLSAAGETGSTGRSKRARGRGAGSAGPIEIRFIIYGRTYSLLPRVLCRPISITRLAWGTFLPDRPAATYTSFDDPKLRLSPHRPPPDFVDQRPFSSGKCAAGVADPARFYRGADHDWRVLQPLVVQVPAGLLHAHHGRTTFPIFFPGPAPRGFDYMHVTTGHWGNKGPDETTRWPRQLWGRPHRLSGVVEKTTSPGAMGPAAAVMRRFYESLEQNVLEHQRTDQPAGPRRLGAAEDRLLASAHLQLRRESGTILRRPPRSPRWWGRSAECRKIDRRGDGPCHCPPRIKARIAEDEQMFHLWRNAP